MTRGFSIDPHSGRRAALAAAELLWETLLLNDRRIRFPSPADPDVSVVIVSYNSSRLLAQTLLHLSQHLIGEIAAVETIIVDNASDGDTQRLLKLVDGAVIVRNDDNGGFGGACNQGAALARGRYILFLNPDIDLMPGAIDALLSCFRLYDRVGIVGARLVFPGGQLQEAGCFFYDDAQITHPYLRGSADASSPEALHAREVAYVSGALLMIDAKLFRALGGFDDAFAPAYFEDADLCVRAIQHGMRVFYQPRAVAIHYENATTPKREAVERLLDANRRTFDARHRHWMFGSGGQPTGFMVRDVNRFRFRVLYIDDRTPHIDDGAGFPRANSIVNTMAAMGYLVTVLPCFESDAEVADRYRDLDQRIEILEAGVDQTLACVINERQGYYDVLWVSRPHNIRAVVDAFMRRGIEPRSWVKGRVIFDTEAVFATRDALKELMLGQRISHVALERAVAAEVDRCLFADIVVCVSASEESILRLYGGQSNVRVLGHALPLKPGPTEHAKRAGVIFVGPLIADDAPNVDSIDWFLAEVWPMVRNRLGAAARLTIVGEVRPEIRFRLERNDIEMLGRVDDLTDVFDRHRVAIAPTRFAAGIPQKVHNSVAHGVPIVVTPLLGAQLAWEEGDGYLTASWQDPIGFAEAVISLHEHEDNWVRIRNNGLKRIGDELNQSDFALNIRNICEDIYTYAAV